jgi:antitoxin component YwqK of YwqJK toxin-antitoxin module
MHYLHGQFNGPYRAWWDNGFLKESGEYADGQRVCEYRWYKEDGTLMQLHTYVATQG